METSRPEDLVGRILTFYLHDGHRVRCRVLAYLQKYFDHSACYAVRVTNVMGVAQDEPKEPEIYIPASSIAMFTEMDFPKFPGELS